MDDDDYDSEDTRTVYVGNVAEEVTEDLLYELFLQAGPIQYVKIPVDKMSKKAKNFAFVCYHHDFSASYAIHLLNNLKLCNRNLRVQPRNNKAPVKSMYEVGIHSLDPDFKIHPQDLRMKLMNKPLLREPPPPPPPLSNQNEMFMHSNDWRQQQQLYYPQPPGLFIGGSPCMNGELLYYCGYPQSNNGMNYNNTFGFAHQSNYNSETAYYHSSHWQSQSRLSYPNNSNEDRYCKDRYSTKSQEDRERHKPREHRHNRDRYKSHDDRYRRNRD